MQNIKLLVWDLDGTLVDSLPNTFLAFNAALEPHLKRTLSGEEIMMHFGPPDQEIMAKLAGPQLAAECIEVMTNAFQKLLPSLSLFEEVSKVVPELHDKGFKQAIFTGRGRRTTEMICEKLGLHQWFEYIVTNDDVSKHKPHPEGFLEICEQFSVNPNEALMLGDSVADMYVAHDGGTEAVWCQWGARKPVLPIAKDPRGYHHTIRHGKELIAILR